MSCLLKKRFVTSEVKSRDAGGCSSVVAVLPFNALFLLDFLSRGLALMVVQSLEHHCSLVECLWFDAAARRDQAGSRLPPVSPLLASRSR